MGTTFKKCTTEPAGWQWDKLTTPCHGSLRYGMLCQSAKPQTHFLYVEGLSEFAEKTFELARDMAAADCHFYVLDRFGQGRSGRPLADRFKQHSSGFQDDINDLALFKKTVIDPQNHDNKPVILLGHSTGGLISLMALHEHPDCFDGAVMTAPLFGFHHPLIQGRESLFSHIPALKFLTERYVPGGRSWTARTDPKNPLTPEEFSSDPVRNTVQDYWQIKDEALQTGSPTFGWLKTVCRAIKTVESPAYLQSIDRPVLMFTAGDDKLVNTAASFNICAGLPTAQSVHFENGRHELFMEKDEIRDPLLEKTLAFAKNTSFRKP